MSAPSSVRRTRRTSTFIEPSGRTVTQSPPATSATTPRSRGPANSPRMAVTTTRVPAGVPASTAGRPIAGVGGDREEELDGQGVEGHGSSSLASVADDDAVACAHLRRSSSTSFRAASTSDSVRLGCHGTVAARSSTVSSACIAVPATARSSVGVGSDDVHAEDLARGGVGHELQVAVAPADGDGPAVGGQVDDGDGDVGAWRRGRRPRRGRSTRSRAACAARGAATSRRVRAVPPAATIPATSPMCSAAAVSMRPPVTSPAANTPGDAGPARPVDGHRAVDDLDAGVGQPDAVDRRDATIGDDDHVGADDRLATGVGDRRLVGLGAERPRPRAARRCPASRAPRSTAGSRSASSAGTTTSPGSARVTVEPSGGEQEGVLDRERGVGRAATEHERGGRRGVERLHEVGGEDPVGGDARAASGTAHRAPAATTTDWRLDLDQPAVDADGHDRAATSSVARPASTSTLALRSAAAMPPASVRTSAVPAVAERGGGRRRRRRRARRGTPSSRASSDDVHARQQDVRRDARPVHARAAEQLGLGEHHRRALARPRPGRRRSRPVRRR